MNISNETRDYWAWIVQREYEHVLQTYSHIENEGKRTEYESVLIKRLDEYNRELLGRNLAQQIALNKKAKMCNPALPDLFVRYPHLF